MGESFTEYSSSNRHKKIDLTYSRGGQPKLRVAGHELLQWMWDTYLYNWHGNSGMDVFSNYIKDQASTEEVTLEDCAVGE